MRDRARGDRHVLDASVAQVQCIRQLFVIDELVGKEVRQPIAKRSTRIHNMHRLEEKLLKFSNEIRLPDDLTILEVGFNPIKS